MNGRGFHVVTPAEVAEYQQEYERWLRDIQDLHERAVNRFFLSDPICRFLRRPPGLVLHETYGPVGKAVDKGRELLGQLKQEESDGDTGARPDRASGSREDVGGTREDGSPVGERRENPVRDDSDWTHKVFAGGDDGDGE